LLERNFFLLDNKKLSTDIIYNRDMRVCIVGAGVSGIQVADVMERDGHACHVFERESTVGGIWRQNYAGFGLQVPHELYEFCNVQSHKAGTFPPGAEIHEYIQHFFVTNDLSGRCTFSFNVSVLGIESIPEGWKVTTTDGTYEFDYCVMCTGMYNTPFIPSFISDKQPANGSATIHASDFTDADVARDKKVLVVGGGKSAIDCAVAAASVTDDVTLCSRTMHWPIPRRILGVIPFQWTTYSRAGHALLPPHWDLSRLSLSWHQNRYVKAVKRAIWRVVEMIVKRQFGLKRAPVNPIDVDLFSGGQILDNTFYDRVSSGRIRHVVTEDVGSELDRMQKQGGAEMLTICGTGFRKDYSIFDSDTRTRLDVQGDGLWLYKNILPPGVENLAFIGSEVSTFNNILTQKLQVEWLSHLIKKSLVPGQAAMAEYVDRERRWKRSFLPDSPSRAALLQLHMTRYHDILLQDMEIPPVRVKWWELLLPITARDYGDTFPSAPSPRGSSSPPP
jgi:dimethylaniline monooxygenase (N-oxide forming)